MVRTHGFTLVELMVAMLLAAMVTTITYQLFETTADALGEVDSLAESTAQARFAMERMRSDFAMAGALATPDSDNDIWTKPAPTPAGRVIGITAYNGWQDNTVLSDTAKPLYSAANIGGGVSPYVSADGIIVMGAYDFPMSIETTGYTDVGAGNPKILAHARGLYKLYSPDPFRTGGEPPPGPDFNAATIVDDFKDQWSTRLLRVSDRQGYAQFVGLNPMVNGNHNPALPPNPASINLILRENPYFKGGTLVQDFGLDVNPDGDTAYDSALIDAFWYHVESDAENPNLIRLVRTRLCADELATALAVSPSVSPDALRADTCGGRAEDVVVAERVADFQIWFECGNTLTGRVANEAWDDDWIRPNANNIAGHCMNVTNAGYAPQLARLMNIRLTIHAESERPALKHTSFENTGGLYGDAAITATPNVRLKTYDINSDLEGAAPVVTFQTSIELMNSSFRNPI